MIKKPGRPKKKKRKMPKPPPEKHCRSCNSLTGRERWCHSESRIHKMECGGGIMGDRISHDKTAWLCMDCDQSLSQPLPKNATEEELQAHADEWWRLIELSH
jgi:hypothetical protein